jgi:hypothetical protein
MIKGSKGWAALVTASLLTAGGCRDDIPADTASVPREIAFDTLFEIGAAQGGSRQAFRGIWDVEVSPSGNVAILDIETGQVHVYDEAGNHLGSVVESGLDPGALEGPSALAWRSADELLIWDAGSSWISTFAVGPSGVDFVGRERAFAFGETGFCAEGDRTYLSYWQDSLIVHELGPDGPLRSFGRAPEIPGMSTLGPELREIGIEELSPSALLCTPNGVLDASVYSSRVRFHDSDGAVLWENDLADFNPMVVYTPDGMGLGRRFDAAAGTNLLQSVVRWGDENALVQHELRTREIPEEGEVPVIESRVVRLSDGVEVERTRALPLVRASWGRRLYVVESEPYPRVVVIESPEDPV